MFPGPGASVDYNEAGEPIGWDYPQDYSDVAEAFDDYYDGRYDDQYALEHEEDADPDTCEHDGWEGTGKDAKCSWCGTPAVGEYQDGTYEDGTPFRQPIWPNR